MEEEKDFELPIEFKREIIDIMNDSPTIKKIGNKDYRIYRLRAYSLNRILKISLKLMQDNKDATDDKMLLYLVCSDMEASAEIIAIILCNHLFNPDDIVDYTSAFEIESKNDKIIKMMKLKIMYSNFNPSEWASLILSLIKDIDLSSFFMSLTLANHALASIVDVRKRTEETLLQWKQAQSLGTAPTS